ncbi:hypothetical protein BH23PLA1_BH23PLA1_32900 [soil metagenome]
MSLDRTLVQIRERSFLDVLDLALVVLRRRPLALGLTAFLGIAPWALLNGLLTSGTGDARPALMLLLILLEAPLATAPLTIVLGGLMFGARPSARQVVRTLARQAPLLLLYQGVIRGGLLLTVVFAWVVPAKLAFLNEVILLERGRMSKVLSRTSDLTTDRGGELFAQWIVQFLFGGMFVLAFWLALDNALDIFHNRLAWEEPTWENLLGPWPILGLWMVVAFFGVVRFLTYIDQRIRLEGWEVELRLRAVGAAMREESEPW